MIYAENILICIAVPLLIATLFTRGNTQRFVISSLVGMGVCLLAAYISGFVCSVSGMGEEETAIFISPVIEEIMKLIPLLFYLMMFKPEDEQILIHATGIGTGFATFENCCYILTKGAASLPYIMIRGMAVGVMHIVSILALAFGIILARKYNALSFSSLAGALALSMTFHGLYNLLVSAPGVASLVGYALPLITAVFLFIIYRRIDLKQ